MSAASTGALDGQVALVTGAARGQGRAHAHALARAGATVIACDIAAQIASVPYPLASPDDLDETVTSIRADGGRAHAEIVDVRDSAAVDGVVERILGTHGRVDILVANAGICGYKPVTQIDDQTWLDMIATNLTGAFHCIRAVLPPMTARGYGRIVAISSGAGRAGMANLAHYSASKWGLIGLVKTVALETARDGITANVVCPTTVATPMVVNDATFGVFCPELAAPTRADVEPRLAGMSPMRVPWLQPEDVTRAVLYLVTDPGCTSGAVLDVNLGTSAART